MNKWQRILIALLGLQLALGVFVFWPRPAASGASQPLLPGYKTGDVTGVTITDDKGATVKLLKQGDKWVAPDAGDYPVDAAKITPVLDKLTGIKAGKPVATTAASLPQLQVADTKFQRRVDLTKADNSMQSVFLGSAAGGQSVHVRLGGRTEVYIASGLGTWEVNADLLSWVNSAYLTVNTADITSLSLTNKNGSFNLTKDAQGQWQLAGLGAADKLDQSKATSLLTAASTINLTKPLGKTEDPAWGMKNPAAVLTLQVKSGASGSGTTTAAPAQAKTITLTVGAQDAGDKSYVVKSSESEYYVRVAEFSVQDFVSRDKAGFLAAPPTPAAAPAGPAAATPTP